MIFCIFGGGKCRPRWGVQRGLPLALLGNFQRYVVLRLGKFPNKLRYFLRKYPAACRPSAFRRWLSLPPAYPYNPTLLFFPFGRWWVAGRSFPFSKAFPARGGRMQGLGEEYYPKHEDGDCSPNGVAARPCSRRKAPCLLCLCKRE